MGGCRCRLQPVTSHQSVSQSVSPSAWRRNTSRAETKTHPLQSSVGKGSSHHPTPRLVGPATPPNQGLAPFGPQGAHLPFLLRANPLRAPANSADSSPNIGGQPWASLLLPAQTTPSKRPLSSGCKHKLTGLIVGRTSQSLPYPRSSLPSPSCGTSQQPFLLLNPRCALLLELPGWLGRSPFTFRTHALGTSHSASKYARHLAQLLQRGPCLPADQASSGACFPLVVLTSLSFPSGFHCAARPNKATQEIPHLPGLSDDYCVARRSDDPWIRLAAAPRFSRFPPRRRLHSFSIPPVPDPNRPPPPPSAAPPPSSRHRAYIYHFRPHSHAVAD